jgi:tRNA(fMet)-specific endonuclease VapC
LRYLIDTNVCIAIINGKSPHIEDRLVKELRANAQMSVSSISAFELWYGVAKSARRPANTQRTALFLNQWVGLLPFDEEDARFAGELRAELESIGRPIGAYDLLIAAQALRHDMIFVTANVREFGRVKRLKWEDWSRI